jgi:phospholipase/carboxylesterase
MSEPISRRTLLAVGGAAALAVVASGCQSLDRAASLVGGQGEDGDGRLSARPQRVRRDAPTGHASLGLAERRDAILYVPRAYTPDRAWPFVVGLHGAGGRAKGGMRLFRRWADEDGLIILAPPSREASWDVRYGGFGPDVAFIDRALGFVFSRYRVDPSHLMLAGFSDGASYALSLGLINGDLFSHLVAFSPGFVADGEPHGEPEIFIAHGVQDPVLPIDQTSRVIVPDLRRQGYDVTYVEFEGVHHVEPENQIRALRWFLG